MDEADYEKEIAQVEGTFLGVEDHGILTAIIYLDYGVGVQGAGMYTFDTYNRPREGDPYAPMYDSERVGTAYGAEWIRLVLKAFGAEKWEDLPGRNIYALKKKGDKWGPVLGFAPLPFNSGKMFLFSQLEPLANTRLVKNES